MSDLDAFLSQELQSSEGPVVQDLVPATLVTTAAIHFHLSQRPLVALLDSGSTATLFNRRALPSGCNTFTLPKCTTVTTAGTFTSSQGLYLTDLKLIEFSPTKKINSVTMRVFNSPECVYDIIIGRDLLIPMGMDLRFSDKVMVWEEKEVPMKSRSSLATPSLFCDATEEDLFGDAFMYGPEGPIKESKYEQVDPSEVVKQQTHLTPDQCSSLQKVLESVNRLFNGTLGCYPHKKIKLELKEGSIPVHCKPFPVPKAHEEVFKKECARLVDVGVLAHTGATEHAYPTFIVKKKDGRVRWVSDFRILNSMLKRKVFPLPRIQDMLNKRRGYKYFTKIDISMCYYTFELDEESQQLCVIVTPFGKYKYQRLPMGISCAPDHCQEIMTEIFEDLEDVEVFIDDIGIFTDGTYEQHMATIREVLRRLDINGFTVNPLKCEWCVQETDWLGYWLTPTGLKPWKKKIDAILKLKEPANIKELRSFIGAVNYYRDMFPRRAHILSPLTSLTGCTKFQWSKEHQDAFNAMKALLATDAMLRYPDHNLPFDIYTDASDYQLGSVILQGGFPVAYFSRKLNPAQRNYTTIEKELLSIVETFKEFRSMLLGARITVYTDHKNLTYANLNTQRVLRWRLYLEEYAPTFKYIQGTKNILADFLSRTPMKSTGAETDVMAAPTAPTVDVNSETPSDVPGFDIPCPFACCRNDPDFASHSHDSFSIFEDPELADCWLAPLPGWESFFFHLPANTINPLDYRRLHYEQQLQPAIWNMPQLDPMRYSYQQFNNQALVCYRPYQQHNYKIMLPTDSVGYIIHWFHEALNHVGGTRLHNTIASTFYHPNLLPLVKQFVQRCSVCQQHKLPGIGYGQLPERDAKVQPFHEVAVDLIGPWKVTIGGQDHVFRALTSIDPVSNLAEIARIDRPTSEHVAWKFEQSWLSRYPRPSRCIHDQGGEFTGDPFQQTLTRAGIQDVPTTVRNPQANAICERMHQTIAQMLKTLLRTNPPATLNDATLLVEKCLAAAQLSLRATVHRTLGVSPGSIVFHRDMLLDFPYLPDFMMLRDRRQALIDYNLRRENNRRRTYDYHVGDQVLEILDKEKRATLGLATKGPFVIQQVHTNGTVTIQRSPLVSERVNIRNIRPLHS